MKELVYANNKCQQVIQAQFPQAKFADASDQIHTERFEVFIDGEEDHVLEEFYVFAIKEGFVLECLGFQMMMQGGEHAQQIKQWMEKAEIALPATQKD